MSMWRALLSAFCSTPDLPLPQEVEEVVRRRSEVSRFTAQVHSAAQVSALDIIDQKAVTTNTSDGTETTTGRREPLDAFESAFRGKDDIR